MEFQALKDIIKAIILCSKEPVKINEILRAFDDCEDIEVVDIEQAISALLDEDDPIYDLKKIAGGYEYEIKIKFSPWIQKSKGIEPDASDLSNALLITVAIIAYYQPVSREEIYERRGGVQTNAKIYQQLESRGWIEEVELEGRVSRAILYKTTDEFLRYFRLKSIFDLPPIEALIND